MQRSFATIHKIIDLLHGGLLILNEQGFHVFQYKLRQWINRKLNISQKPQIPNDEAQEIAFGGERVTHLYPNDLYYAHLSIYWFASKFVKDKIVLDAGCGDGYGTNYLAEHGAKQIVGIDISQIAINACKKYYSRENLRYQVVDLAKIESVDTLENKSVDLIFSSNALEHVAAVKHFLDRCHELLTPDGLFIVAVPPIVDQGSREANISNPYHLNIWSPAQWKFALSLYFDEIQCYTHNLKKPGTQLNLTNTPDETHIKEDDFEFQQIAMDDYYARPGSSLTILFFVSKPRPSIVLPNYFLEIPMIDESFTRELSLQ